MWHVDDLKISHEDTSVIDRMIVSLRTECGKVGEMTVQCEKIYDYLGMTLDFSNPGKLSVDMEKYIDKILRDIPEDMSSSTLSPAAGHLFKMSHNTIKLDKKQALVFLHVNAQLLLSCKGGRPDIHTAISFLYTHVKESDQDNYKKLA